MNSCVLLVFDSCRYDTMSAAWPTLQNIPKLGMLNRAYSLSTWTFTSHILFALGRLPWIESRTDVTQQKTELADLQLWGARLGLVDDHPFREDRDFRTGLHRLGYELNAITSANPLTEDSRFSFFVDSLISVGQFENCFDRVLPHVKTNTLQFLIINVCETHYPYFEERMTQNFLLITYPVLPRKCERPLRIVVLRFLSTVQNCYRYSDSAK
jgi:hypothetical protein